MIKQLIQNLKEKTINMDTLEGINRIKENGYTSLFDGEFTEHIVYKLQQKATEHKKNSKMELAIACLEKAYKIMLNTNNFYGDYADRYVSYLKKDRQFDKARKVEEEIENYCLSNDEDNIEVAIKNAKKLKTDLVEADYVDNCDALTAIYRGRIFSISGKSKKFPKLPTDINKTALSLYPYFDGISEPSYCKKGTEVEYSNRPFIDNRSKAEIKMYEDACKEVLEDEKNQNDYDWIWEHLPDIAPKSLSGYVRMKKSNSKNFNILKEKAKQEGYII